MLESPHIQTCNLPNRLMTPEITQDHTNKFKVLSIDGGGTKGLYCAKIIEGIENEYGSRISDHFDLICGTSTGGLIALALSLGIPASDIVRFYLNHSANIFPNRNIVEKSLRTFSQLLGRGKYDNKALIDALWSLFGDRTLKESKCLLCIPSFSLSDGRPYIFKRDHSEGNLTRDNSTRYLDVALATSAAPTYLPVATIENHNNRQFIDGGIYANNPSLVGIIEAFRYFVGDGKQFDRLGLLSIATPEPIPGARRMKNTRRSVLHWNSGLIKAFFDGQIGMTNYVVDTLAHHCNPGLDFVRIPGASLNNELSRTLQLDSASTESLDALAALGSDMFLQYRGDPRIRGFFEKKKIYLVEG